MKGELRVVEPNINVLNAAMNNFAHVQNPKPYDKEYVQKFLYKYYEKKEKDDASKRMWEKLVKAFWLHATIINERKSSRYGISPDIDVMSFHTWVNIITNNTTSISEKIYDVEFEGNTIIEIRNQSLI